MGTVAVLGGGHTGHAHAACLALAGHDVNFYEHPMFQDSFAPTLDAGAVEIEEEKTGRRAKACMRLVTTDISAAIDEDVSLVFVLVPAFGQQLFFETMIPSLRNGQSIVIWTGNLGSLVLRRILDQTRPGLQVQICEISSQPFAVRLTGPARVGVHWGFAPWLSETAMGETPKRPVLISALPASGDGGTVLQPLLGLYPQLQLGKNVLACGLANGNLMSHPAGCVLNAGRIEYADFMGQEFRYHLEAHTHSVQRVEAKVAEELNALARAVGSNVQLSRTRTREYAAMQREVPLRHVSIGPRTLKDRYLTEDVPYGLVPMSQLAEKFGVETPTINAVVELASVLNGEDYRTSGRTLESLGLEKMSPRDILRLVDG